MLYEWPSHRSRRIRMDCSTEGWSRPLFSIVLLETWPCVRYLNLNLNGLWCFLPESNSAYNTANQIKNIKTSEPNSEILWGCLGTGG